MAIIKCKMCGGDLNLVEDASTAECEYCGSVQTVPKVDDEKKLTLFARANRLRAACEFDKAAGIYESIVADFPEEAEAYWGLVLCKYGIEYVDDPATGKKIPTCHRSSFDSLIEDSDFEQALENADPVARKVYRGEAKVVEEIRKGIIAVSANEEPYDIFVCYKETDETGSRTLDSVLAQDVYDALTDKGYRVFFSRITLEDKLGMEYEPYIFAALNSAKIMLVVGTDYEYFNAVWVKNEWSRYLKLMAKDKSKYLIPCYKGIDAYDMPKEFAKLQAQDLGKVGATQDLLRGIEKLRPRQAQNTAARSIQLSDSNALVIRGQFALDDGDWEKANEFFERALDENPSDGEAYLGKVVAALRLREPAQIDELCIDLYEFKDFDRAIRFSDVTKAKELTEIRERAHRNYHAKRTENTPVDATQQKPESPDAEKQEAAPQLSPEQIEKRKELKEIRERWAIAQSMISAGRYRTIALKSDGRAISTKIKTRAYKDIYNISWWRNLVAVSAGMRHAVGLKQNGTVVRTDIESGYPGQERVTDWKNIVAVSVGMSHTVGLKADGTVVAAGFDQTGNCDVSGWRDIVAISAGRDHTVGLKADGTVVATKYTGDGPYYGQCDVEDWTDIVAISAAVEHTVGLKADGTVVATKYLGHPNLDRGLCAVENWTDIVAISASRAFTLGLRKDGTVVVAGAYFAGKDEGRKELDLSQWRNIVAISAHTAYVVGLRSDGTVISSKHLGDPIFYEDQCNVAGWRLFKDIRELEELQKRAPKLQKVLK